MSKQIGNSTISTSNMHTPSHRMGESTSVSPVGTQKLCFIIVGCMRSQLFAGSIRVINIFDGSKLEELLVGPARIPYCGRIALFGPSSRILWMTIDVSGRS